MGGINTRWVQEEADIKLRGEVEWDTEMFGVSLLKGSELTDSRSGLGWHSAQMCSQVPDSLSTHSLRDSNLKSLAPSWRIYLECCCHFWGDAVQSSSEKRDAYCNCLCSLGLTSLSSTLLPVSLHQLKPHQPFQTLCHLGQQVLVLPTSLQLQSWMTHHASS